MLSVALYFGIILLPSEEVKYTSPNEKEIEISLALSVSASKSRLWKSPVDYPEGMVKYSRGEHTQAIFRSGFTRTLNKVNVRALDPKWVTSGGLQHISGWRSEKYKYIPEEKEIAVWLGPKRVSTGTNRFQEELGINRSYPNGTRFDDVLINSNTGEVFEHRTVEKINGKWKRGSVYENEAARPVGYTGLKQSCVSCHREAGTGAYGEGLVPGGDTIISDPLDFSVWPTEGDKKTTQEISNPWQWTDEDGGYWWKWKSREEIKPEPKLDDLFPRNQFSDPFTTSFRPTIRLPQVSIPQMNFVPMPAPSFNFSSGGGVCST